MVELEVIDLNESIRLTAEMAQHQVQSYPIELDLKLSPSSPRVLAPAAELTQAILSLLMNSVETVCTSSRSSGRIQITSAVIRDRVLVSVMDDVPAKESGMRFRGSRSMIREIGGELLVSSRESFGTTSTIDLPLGGAELTTA